MLWVAFVMLCLHGVASMIRVLRHEDFGVRIIGVLLNALTAVGAYAVWCVL